MLHVFFIFVALLLFCQLLDGHYLTCLATRYVRLHMSTLVVVGSYLFVGVILAWLFDLGIVFLFLVASLHFQSMIYLFKNILLVSWTKATCCLC